MIQALAFALLLALQEPQEEAVASGNILLRVPAGWKAEDSDKGLFLRPGDLKPGEVYVVVLADEKADGNLQEGFEKFWKKLAGQGKLAQRAPGRETKTDGGTDGLLSVGLLEDPAGARTIVMAAMFKPGDRYTAVLAMTTDDAVFQRYRETFRILLKGLRFKNVELPVPPVEYELFVVTGAVPLVYTLFKDGSLLGLLPKEGLEGFDLGAAKKRLEGSWGTHETKDGTLTLRLGDRFEKLPLKPDGTYLRPGVGSAHRVSPAAGLKLDGRYLPKDKEDRPDTPFILFKPDGTFEDRGAAVLVVPDGSTAGTNPAGTYEVAQNTLTLKFLDSRIKRMAILPLPQSKDLLLGSTVFRPVTK